MPDIAMCEGTGCPMKDDCYRATAVPNEHRQSYFVNVPVVWVDEWDGKFAECSEFIEPQNNKQK